MQAADRKATLKGDAKGLPMPVKAVDTPYGSVCSLEALVHSVVTLIDKAAEGYDAAAGAYEAARAKTTSSPWKKPGRRLRTRKCRRTGCC